jgi:hypothetical protein
VQKKSYASFHQEQTTMACCEIGHRAKRNTAGVGGAILDFREEFMLDAEAGYHLFSVFDFKNDCDRFDFNKRNSIVASNAENRKNHIPVNSPCWNYINWLMLMI